MADQPARRSGGAPPAPARAQNNGLPPQGDIFDRAYAYITEHY
jgi:hypothetical protein